MKYLRHKLDMQINVVSWNELRRNVSNSKVSVVKNFSKLVQTAESILIGSFVLLNPLHSIAQVNAEVTPLSNPYGLQALWSQGDLVARGTLLVLVLMSLASWYVMVTKYIEQSRVQNQTRAVGDEFWSGESIRQSAEKLDSESPYRFIASKGLESASKHHGMLDAIDFNTWVTMSIQRAMSHIQGRMQEGLAMLATVGSTAPFVGLFGTVWGIYNALVSIGMSGQASIDKVAGPVGESLIMTAIGLAVAVPAVLGYNWLVPLPHILQRYLLCR